MKKFITGLSLIVLIAISLTACSSEYDKYIEEVKTGYLGGCLDVTVDEVFSQTLPDGKWDSGETDSGKIIVEYKSSVENIETAIQFTITDENHFSVSGISADGITPETDEEGALYIDSRYIQYYGIQYPDKAAIDFMPNEPTTNLMQGISAAYAEKAKNPIDISNYFEKPKDDIISDCGLMESGGIYKNNEFSILYDDEEAKVFSANLINSRIYSLFGVQTYKDVEESLNKISDRFEKISEQEGTDNAYSIMLKRNNSSDSLIISYDMTTNSVKEITYMYDGLSDYEADDENEDISINKADINSSDADANDVNSISEAIEAVKAYVKREGYSDPYDMYEAEYYAGYYQVYAGHSYLGDDWIEDSFIVYEDDSNNVQLVQP